ncbi:MAG: hypothetical protein R3A44_27270 [Caldilineaceae bacterium]
MSETSGNVLRTQLLRTLPLELQERLKSDPKLQREFEEVLLRLEKYEINLEEARRKISKEINDLDDFAEYVGGELDKLRTVFFSEVVKLIDDIRARLDNVPPDTEFGHMTYREAVDYFLRQKPKFEFARGVMLREKQGDEQVIFTQVFLDQYDQILTHNGKVVGRKLFVRQLDPELDQFFAEHDVVVVE